jgi:hypothetical protein
VTVSAKFDTPTIAAIQAVQTANGIAVTGTTDASTWQAVLKLAFTPVDWTASAAKASAVAKTARRAHKSELHRVDSAQQR